MKAVCIAIFIFLFFPAFSQKLLSGPMQGHTTSTSMKVWVLVKKADSVSIVLTDRTSGKKHFATTKTDHNYAFKKKYPLIFELKDLAPNTLYSYTIQMDDKTVEGDHLLKTFQENKDKDFSFMIGSCAITVPWLFRPLHPGNEERIYPSMIDIPSDFMLWLGDYLYYVFFQYRSYENMFRKHIFKRKVGNIRDFLQSRPQYAVWDDHDFGPNDGDSRWELKNESLKVFKMFWPNPSYGLEDAEGCFFNFTHQDAEFFMTDNRFHRKPIDDSIPEMFGRKQLEWLKQKLSASTATFKFVIIGNQVLNKMNEGDCYMLYEDEYRELMNFIKEKEITGIIFLSGDRHFTELIKVEREDAYPLYEFTSSPITSIGHMSKNLPELFNPDIVNGTIVLGQNYGRITISGENGSRNCLMETFDRKGTLLWQYEIPESWLR